MVSTITRTAFVPNCVWIPNNAFGNDHRGDHVDPSETTLLMLDGDNNRGEVYTKDAWENDGPPSFQRRSGNFDSLADGDFNLSQGRIDLLPELWVVKIDERDYWKDQIVLSRTTRLYGVYVFDRRLHVHICSFTPCYELHFLGSQWECPNDLSDEEHDDLRDHIQQGDGSSETVTYWDKADIDRFLQVKCKIGCLPLGKEGGCQLTGITSVTTHDAIEAVREAHSQDEF